MSFNRAPRGLLTVNLFRDDIRIRLPDWAGLIFGDLVWRPVSTHRMRVCLIFFAGIAHQPFFFVGHIGGHEGGLSPRVSDNGCLLFEYT